MWRTKEEEKERAVTIVHLILHQNTPPKLCTAMCTNLRSRSLHVRCLRPPPLRLPALCEREGGARSLVGRCLPGS